MLVSANPLGTDIWNTIPGISYYNNSVPISATGPSASVLPGQTATFTFIANAPSPGPGTFNFQWTMMHNFVRFFGDVTPNVVCTEKTDNAAFVSQAAPPATMTAGQSYPVSVTMQNTGDSTWADGTCQLLSENPRGSQAFGPNCRPVVGTVVPGGSTTVSFSAVAPATPGQYNFQWTMSRANIHEFGQFSTSIPVTVVAPSVAVVDLAAVATGSSKITLYWSGYSGAIGYNVYRGQQSGGPYTRINTSGPVNTADNSAGSTNTFMDSDSPLTTGTTYYYYVAPVMQDGSEAGSSNEDSATPIAGAVPWDTANPTQIINAVNATAALDLEPDIDDSGDSYPAQVGVVEVAGPDGSVYAGNFPDGSPAQAFTSHAYSDGNSIYYDDGRVIAPPNYDQTDLGTTNAVASAGLSPQSATVPDKSPFPATNIPSGIYREVNSVPGYTGFSGIVGIPNASDPQTVNVAINFDTVNGNPYPDALDIYTGGYVYKGGATTVGASGPSPLDAGLQLTLLPKTPSGTHPVGFWEPVLNGKRTPPIDPTTGKPNLNALLPSVFLDGSTKALPTGTFEYKEKLSGEVKMQFLTPAAPDVTGESVELHFSLPLTGVGSGQITLMTINPKTLQTTSTNVNEVTLVYYHVPGWEKNSKFVIKRINSIAQTLRSHTPSAYEKAQFDPKHPGAPYPTSPTNQSPMGYLNDGSYVVAPVGSGSFSGAYWGEGDTNGVELRGPNGGWSSWTDSSAYTNAAGAYPNPLAYPKVTNWLEQMPYFWEQNVNLTAL